MVKKVHFIGICGAGMAGAALLLKEGGWEISGSDEGFYPPVSTFLKRNGVNYTPHYARENIPRDADLIVIGKHAKLTPEENGEVRAALESSIPIKSFAEILGEATQERYNIVVAGSYGKSTCAALMAWCLLSAGKSPGYFIGAIPFGFETNTNAGADREFIIEGDEYPASNWDNRSKFLFYHPRDVLLTSATHDHINVFPTLDSYLTPFRQLLKEVPRDGLLVACLDCQNTKLLLKEAPCPVVAYSFNASAEWRAGDIRYGETSAFTLLHNNKPIIKLETPLLGAHNIENIVGVSAYLLSRKLISPEELKKGVAAFRGIARRLDLKTEKSTVRVYEGFGSSYEKARAAIEAVRLHFPQKRLFIIFEPHTFSWRNRAQLYRYDDVFAGADRVLIYNPPTHGSKSHEQLTLGEIGERVEAAGQSVVGITNPEQALAVLDDELGADDLILLLTSGNLGGLIDAIPKFVEQKFPLGT